MGAMDDGGVPATLNDAARRLLDERNFATVATVGPSGQPHSAVVWIDREGDTVVFSLTADKQKARNLARDPRVSASVFDLHDAYHSVEIRGTAELAEDPSVTRIMPVLHSLLTTSTARIATTAWPNWTETASHHARRGSGPAGSGFPHQSSAGI
jgi:PPOX class probable F420-dependent enzyme